MSAHPRLESVGPTRRAASASSPILPAVMLALFLVPTTAPVENSDLTGQWTFRIVDTPQGTLTGTMSFREDGDAVAGDMEFDRRWWYGQEGRHRFTVVSVHGRRVTLEAVLQVDASGVGHPFRYAFSGEVMTGRLTGDVTISGFGRYSFEARKHE